MPNFLDINRFSRIRNFSCVIEHFGGRRDIFFFVYCVAKYAPRKGRNRLDNQLKERYTTTTFGAGVVWAFEVWLLEWFGSLGSALTTCEVRCIQPHKKEVRSMLTT